MDLTLFIPMIVSWVDHTFPSLSEYTKYVGPGLMTLFTLLGIFTNMLPEPGHHYPVPDTTELENELKDHGGFIIRIAKFTRSIVIVVNWFLATVVYEWFYTTTNRITDMLPRFIKPKPKSS